MGTNVPVDSLVNVPGLLLYSVESLDTEVLLVFLQVGCD